MSKKEIIFRVGESVFDPNYGGWGVVENIRLEIIVVRFSYSDLEVRYSFENAEKKLSFTEYDYVNGGFSQERPMPTISMPYLNSRFNYITRDKLGVFLHEEIPLYCKERDFFRHELDADTDDLINVICTSNINMNVIYKIIDNDQ